MVTDYRPTHHLGPCMLSDASTATSHFFSPLLHALPLCFVSVCQFCHSPTLQPLCLLSLRHHSFILHLFVSICLSASCLVQLMSPSCAVCLYPTHDLFIRRWCIFCLKRVFFFPVAVVPWILPHSQPGPERL